MHDHENTCLVSVTGTHLNIRKDVSPTVTHFFSLMVELQWTKEGCFHMYSVEVTNSNTRKQRRHLDQIIHMKVYK